MNPTTLLLMLPLISTLRRPDSTSEKLPMPVFLLLLPLPSVLGDEDHAAGSHAANRVEVLGFSPPLLRRRRLTMTKETAISVMAATLPTTGAATHAIDGWLFRGSWRVASGADSADVTGVVLGPGNKNGNEFGTSDEDGVVGKPVIAGLEESGISKDVEVDVTGEADSVTVTVLPAGGVKNTAPLPAPGVRAGGRGGDGRMDTPGSVVGGIGAGATTKLAEGDAT
jgi:hypothetical protein